MNTITYELSSDTANIAEHYDTLNGAISSANWLIRGDNCCWDVSVNQIATYVDSQTLYLCYAVIRGNGEIRVVYQGDGHDVQDYDACDYLGHLEHDTPLPDGYISWKDCKPLIIGGVKKKVQRN